MSFNNFNISIYFNFNSYRKRYFKLTELQFKPIETDVAIYIYSILIFLKKSINNSLKISIIANVHQTINYVNLFFLNYRKMAKSLLMTKISFIKLLIFKKIKIKIKKVIQKKN
jgi:hypothetical protein